MDTRDSRPTAAKGRDLQRFGETRLGDSLMLALLGFLILHASFSRTGSAARRVAEREALSAEISRQGPWKFAFSTN